MRLNHSLQVYEWDIRKLKIIFKICGNTCLKSKITIPNIGIFYSEKITIKKYWKCSIISYDLFDLCLSVMNKNVHVSFVLVSFFLFTIALFPPLWAVCTKFVFLLNYFSHHPGPCFRHCVRLMIKSHFNDIVLKNFRKNYLTFPRNFSHVQNTSKQWN